MISLAPFIERLKEAGYGHVEGLFEFAQLKAPPRQRACFVIPKRTAPEGAPRVGSYDQKIVLRFTVVIVIPAPGRSPGQASERLKAEIETVEKALFGWQHPEAASGCMLAGGELLDLDAATLAWGHDFTCHYRKRTIR